MDQTPIVDPNTLASLRALNPDDGDGFLREVVTIYLEDTPHRVAELQQGLTAGDRGRISRAAHSIKGSSANIGAERVRGVAEKIELLSKTAIEGLAPLVDDLVAAYAAAETELRKLL